MAFDENNQSSPPPNNSSPLPDLGDLPDVPGPMGFDVLPGFNDPLVNDGGPFPNDFQQFKDVSTSERDDDKFTAMDFFQSDQERHRYQRQFHGETIRVFKAMGRDLANDFYALYELRVRLEASRADIADFGM